MDWSAQVICTICVGSPGCRIENESKITIPPRHTCKPEEEKDTMHDKSGHKNESQYFVAESSLRIPTELKGAEQKHFGVQAVSTQLSDLRFN